jgi:hypothetical protein
MTCTVGRAGASWPIWGHRTASSPEAHRRWELHFLTFRAEVQKVFRRDIPLKDRDDWEEWLQARRAEHQQRTEAIVRMETDLNARVYALFDLTPAEIKIIEESTKYRYGEVEHNCSRSTWSAQRRREARRRRR